MNISGTIINSGWLYSSVLLCNTRSQTLPKFEPGDIPYTMKKRAGAVTTCWDTMGESMARALMELPRELHMYRENVCLCRCVSVGVEGWCPRLHVHLSCLNLSVSLLVLTTRAVTIYYATQLWALWDPSWKVRNQITSFACKPTSSQLIVMKVTFSSLPALSHISTVIKTLKTLGLLSILLVIWLAKPENLY